MLRLVNLVPSKLIRPPQERTGLHVQLVGS